MLVSFAKKRPDWCQGQGDEELARLAAVAGAPRPPKAPLVQAVAGVDPEGALLALRVDGVLPAPGAGFSPDVAPADQLMPPRLAEALQASGAPVGQFRTHGDDVVEPLSWVVEVDAMGADGTPRTYMVTFEPVEGRLLAVVRR